MPNRLPHVRRLSRPCAAAMILWGIWLFVGQASIYGQVLFDATKAEMAGNADWVIDADQHNLDVYSGTGSGTLGGSESNPQRLPTPALSGITSSTSETYWTGALSAWAIALARQGQTVIETLPYNGSITYGSSSNPQDLSNYRVFVVCEPNILFTTTEKSAILNFVKNGGSLFMIADHSDSDRNSDGSDSVQIWNDLLNNNSVQTNPFGFTYNSDYVTPTETVDSSSTDPITHGVAGTATSFNYSDGSTMDLTNSAVAHAAVWETNPTKVMVLYGTFGSGKFVAIGDSSPSDDGKGDPGDTLYNGWNSGSNSRVILNATAWLLTSSVIVPSVTTNAATNVSTNSATLNGTINPNGASTTAQFQYGTTTSYGTSVSISGSLAGSTAQAVSTALANLSPATTYHFRAAGTNSAGTTSGADQTFTTNPLVPVATSNAATNITSSTATLNGSVTPNGYSVNWHFDFGGSTSYGFSSVPQTVSGGTSAQSVAMAVGGMVPGSTYHYRISITSSAGAVLGNDAIFTMLALVDSDGDGMPDSYEISHALNPNNGADAVFDEDGDGASNLMEYLAGTDPGNALDSLHILSTTLSNGNVQVTFPTIFGKHYSLERTENLGISNWTVTGSVIDGDGSVKAFTDGGASSASEEFYRVKVVP